MYQHFNVRKAMDQLGCQVQEQTFLTELRPVFFALQGNRVDIDPQVFFEDRIDLLLGILVSFLKAP